MAFDLGSHIAQSLSSQWVNSLSWFTQFPFLNTTAWVNTLTGSSTTCSQGTLYSPQQIQDGLTTSKGSTIIFQPSMHVLGNPPLYPVNSIPFHSFAQAPTVSNLVSASQAVPLHLYGCASVVLSNTADIHL